MHFLHKISLLSMICFGMLSACANDPPAVPAQETNQQLKTIDYLSLKFDFGTGWKLISAIQQPPYTQTKQFVREGDDVNTWKELVSLQSLAKSQSDPSARGFYNGIKASIESRCPNLTQWKIIEQTEISVLFEWTSDPCQEISPGAHEIARIMDAKYYYYVVRYAAKESSLAPDVRELWLQKLRTASVERVKW